MQPATLCLISQVVLHVISKPHQNGIAKSVVSCQFLCIVHSLHFLSNLFCGFPQGLTSKGRYTNMTWNVEESWPQVQWYSAQHLKQIFHDGTLHLVTPILPQCFTQFNALVKSPFSTLPKCGSNSPPSKCFLHWRSWLAPSLGHQKRRTSLQAFSQWTKAYRGAMQRVFSTTVSNPAL